MFAATNGYVLLKELLELKVQPLFHIDVALDSAVTTTEAKFLFNGMSLEVLLLELSWCKAYLVSHLKVTTMPWNLRRTQTKHHL